MKLYYTKGACSLVSHICINEIGLKCEYESVNLKDKTTASGEDYWKINAKGAVPAILTDDKQVLTENAVILQYLADTHHADKLLPPVSQWQRYRVLEWLNFMATELHKGFGPLFNPQMPDQVKQDITIPFLKKKFEFVDSQLSKTYLMGDEFTLPDCYLFVMLLWAKNMKVDLSHCKNVTRFFEQANQRNSIRKSLEEEGLI